MRAWRCKISNPPCRRACRRAPAGRLAGPLAFAGAVLAAMAAMAAAAPAPARAQVPAADWPQFGNDVTHSGSTSAEWTIHRRNVATLHPLFHVALPGAVDSAPVFLSGVATASGPRDLLFLETRRGIVVALDAATGASVWVTRLPAGPGYTTSAPAIDPNRQFLYAYGLDGKAHKLAVGTGAETSGGGWPEAATLKPSLEEGSADLAVATAAGGSSYLYIASSGYPGAAGDAQGHVTAVDLATGAQRMWNADCSRRAVHFVTGGAPDCAHTQSGIWARAGVAYDAVHDRILFTTGAGPFDVNLGGRDWGDTVVALHPDGSGAAGGLPVDSYTPNDYQDLENNGTDLGSSAPAILPTAPASIYPHLAVQGGAEGELHLIDLDDMSRQGGPGHTAGEIEPVLVAQGGPLDTQPAVWVNPLDGGVWLFLANDNGISAMQLFIDAAGNPTIFTQWTAGGGGTSPVVANGILYYAGSGTLKALDPVFGTVLFSGTGLGAIHDQSPIVTGGRIYVADQNATLWAYGPAAPSLTFHPLAASCRLLDTRGGAPLAGDGTARTLAVAGQCGVPADALGAAVKVTALKPSSGGALDVAPANVTVPALALALTAGQTRTAAQGTVPLTGNPVGSLSLGAHLSGSAAGSVNVLVDVTGFYD